MTMSVSMLSTSPNITSTILLHYNLAHKIVYLIKSSELRVNVSVAPECPVAESKHRQYQNQSVPGVGYILQKNWKEYETK